MSCYQDVLLSGHSTAIGQVDFEIDNLQNAQKLKLLHFWRPIKLNKDISV